MLNPQSEEDFMEFMIRAIQNSPNMVLKEKGLDHIIATYKKDWTNPKEKSARIDFALMNYSEETLGEYFMMISRNFLKQFWTVPIFHKDEFLIRPKENRREILEGLGLQNYDNAWTRQLVEVHPIIRDTLKLQSPLKKIIIYQPGTDKLRESLRAYDFQSANPSTKEGTFSELQEKYMVAREIHQVPKDRLYLRPAHRNMKLLTLGTVRKGPRIREEDYS